MKPVVLAAGDTGFGHSGGGDSWTDDVNANVRRSAALLRENSRGVLERSLLRGISGGTGEKGIGLHRGCQDNGALRPADFMRAAASRASRMGPR